MQSHSLIHPPPLGIRRLGDRSNKHVSPLSLRPFAEALSSRMTCPLLFPPFPNPSPGVQEQAGPTTQHAPRMRLPISTPPLPPPTLLTLASSFFARLILSSRFSRHLQQKLSHIGAGPRSLRSETPPVRLGSCPDQVHCCGLFVWLALPCGTDGEFPKYLRPQSWCRVGLGIVTSITSSLNYTIITIITFHLAVP